MSKITLRNERSLDTQIKRAIQQRMKKVFSQGEVLMGAAAEALRAQFENSEEFQSMKNGPLRGIFGFTDAEVSQLDNVLGLLVPENNEITVTKIQAGPNKFLMQLEWVDLKKLKGHDTVQHKLTRLDASGQEIEVTDIISWVEWLEEGETFRGFQFTRPGRGARTAGGEDPAAFSRSGEGLMRRTRSGGFVIEPTRIFERIAKTGLKPSLLKKGFGVIFRQALPNG